MRPGSMDRRITIQQRTQTRDANGAALDSWSTWAECWAEVKYKQPSAEQGEVYASDKFTAQMMADFRIRYKAGLVPTMRLQYEGQTWNIRAVSEIGRREGWLITAQVWVD